MRIVKILVWFQFPEILEELKARDTVWKNKFMGAHRLPLVEVTGGEPMLQNDTPELLRELCEAGYTVLLETNGSIDLRSVDDRVRKIVDVKGSFQWRITSQSPWAHGYVVGDG